MKKVFAAIAVFAGIALANDASAQTRYGTSVPTKNGNTTTYTCPQTSNSVCQIWGNNADGSRYVIVILKSPDGDKTISVGVRKAEVIKDHGMPWAYFIDQADPSVIWEATSSVD